jgi:3-hydroxyisobutyryl-CoA hydrolase
MSSSQLTDDVLFEQINHIGVITLNRQKQLNALNLSMIRKITPQLRTWEKDPLIDMILIRGTGEQAFCAGGDIKAIRDSSLKGDKIGAMTFFGEEYQLNYLISTFKKPYIALINGITMGGGVGLSVHGRFRIATEKTMFAMPETAIGFFPDVGGMHVLSKLGTLGLYLALTGHRLKGQDVFTSGIATHYLQSSQLSEFEKNLFGNDGGSLENLQNMLGQFKLETHSTINREDIEQAFSGESVEQIYDNLDKMNTDWSRKQINLLDKMSPTSLKVTFKQFHACNGKSLK